MAVISGQLSWSLPLVFSAMLKIKTKFPRLIFISLDIQVSLNCRSVSPWSFGERHNSLTRQRLKYLSQSFMVAEVVAKERVKSIHFANESLGKIF